MNKKYEIVVVLSIIDKTGNRIEDNYLLKKFKNENKPNTFKNCLLFIDDDQPGISKTKNTSSTPRYPEKSESGACDNVEWIWV